MTSQTIYTVGGTVQAGGGLYIKRKADDELLKYCRAGEFAFILSSRQVGKSSLMVRTAQQLEKENIRSVIIDLSGIGVKISADEWYLGILSEIANTLELKTDIFKWWSERSGLGPAQKLINFFRDVLLKEINEQIVIFLDEIDSTLSIPFSDDFFASLRAIYNARSTIEDFRRLSFVLIGVATPGQLIADSKRTPFNIGYRVDLTDFTLEEALPLISQLNQQVLTWILAWTGGHPYLTQRLCEYISKSEIEITEEFVEKAVKNLFEGEEGRQDNNLQFVRDMLTKRSPDLSRVLRTYKDIQNGKKVRDDERSIAKSHLKISGVVRSESGSLVTRNRIYKRVFTTNWAQDNIPKNWTKITAIAFGLLSFVLLSIFIYDFVVDSLSRQYAGSFYTSRSNEEKLENLARLFELEGILQNTSYDFRARELFYSLNWKEQTDLFEDLYDSEYKQKYLVSVIEGLYVTMANIEGNQDNSELLLIMKKSLEDVDTPSSKKLQEEITLWLEARNETIDEDKLEKYNNAILVNNNNPATRYERAVIALKLRQYAQALIDLDVTMGLAQNLSSEASEKEIATPTQQSTSSTSILQTESPSPLIVFTSTNQPIQTPTFFPASTGVVNATQTLSITTPIPTNALPMSPNGEDLITREGYKSSFYSIAYIRSAIDIILQRYKGNPDFEIILNNRVSSLTYLESAGLITTIPISTLAVTSISVDVLTPNILESILTPVAPVPIGEDWVKGCISSLWRAYPSTVQTVERGDGCLQEPVHVFSADFGDLDFFYHRTGRGESEVHGLFAPLPESGTVTFTIRIRDLTNVDLLMGIFAQPDVNSNGLLMIMLNGGVQSNVFIQKDPSNYVTIQGTQKLNQDNGYSISFRFDNLSVISIVNPNVFVTNSVSVPSSQKWLFLGYKGLRDAYRVDGTFLSFELKP